MKFCLKNLQWLFSEHIDGRVTAPWPPIRQLIWEVNALYDAAVQSSKWHPDLPMLEIGRFLGGSTLILHAASNGRHLTSVDIRSLDAVKNHLIKKTGEFKQIQQRCISEVQDLKNVTILDQDSKKKIEGVFGFLMIDGDHSFEGVLSDTLTHWPCVTPGGMVVYHDYDNLHVGVKAVGDWLLSSGCCAKIDHVEKLLILRKIEELPHGRPKNPGRSQ